MWRDGVTSFMPTIVSHSLKDTVDLAGAWASCLPPTVASSIMGLHLEGPFISPEEGPRGAHDAQWITEPRLELVERCQTVSGGMVRLVTMSPHWEGSAEFVRAVTSLGITVSIGHTTANSSQIRLAVNSGATLSTHLGNGTHIYLPRHRNYLWDQLAEDRLWASVIGDGFHLPYAVMKVILRSKENRVYLISDAVALTGSKPGHHRTSVGGSVYLHENGKLSLSADSELLAGAATPLKGGVAQMVSSGLGDMGTMWDLASCRPSTFWRRATCAGLAVGAPADIVLFEDEAGHINIRQTIKDGHIVYDELQ
ncbi:MAG: N-acetylglucosamine-6-phosphate deacetylase [Sulfobacillus acidophilus]|uniref:N-acetylglucosamine-6-phosphate deacetylase n=1 Tax=Sulfobacillus acidophilus TaxID=53633 RepID=A0A2T2WGR9_9FIRM|nr:MAG: N-acetylglucosamine-6-phosphate deacetylase [Sulfobacillus acidophilus]